MAFNDQISFANVGFEHFRKTTKRAKFLEEMDRLIPWDELCAVIAPYYAKSEAGRPRIDLLHLLRIHFLQQWFNLSDPAMEEALHDVRSMQEFARVDLANAAPPDETTICRFRHLLEKHDLGKKLFDAVNAFLKEKGIQIKAGTIVDATIINAPSSTKNRTKQRDPEMHQTKKGNNWYFGMKAHIGMDSKTKLIHTLVTTPANVHDSQVLPQLLHGNETRVWGDSAYISQGDAIREKAPKALAFINKRAFKNRPLTSAEKRANRTKSKVRAHVEHRFGFIKGFCGFRKVRYRGLAKNTNRLHVLCALANMFTQKTRLLQSLTG